MLFTLKTQLASFLDVSKDALHVHVGLALYLSLTLILRRRPGSLMPWSIVLLLEGVNEAVDAIHHGRVDFNAGDTMKDLVNTMLWPTVLLILARLGRHRRSGRDNIKA